MPETPPLGPMRGTRSPDAADPSRASVRPLRNLPTAMATALVFLFMPASLIWSPAGGAIFLLLTLLGAGSVLIAPADAWRRLRSMPELLVASGMVFGLNLVSVLAMGLPARELSLLPVLFAPLLALAMTRAHHVVATAAAGGAAAGATALTILLIVWPRAEFDPIVGTLNAIVFAQLALVACAHALSGAGQIARGPWMAMTLAGAAAGALAVVGSGTRGAILALPAVAGLLWSVARRFRDAPRGLRRLGAALALALLFGGVSLGAKTHLDDRFARISQEIRDYREGQIGERSVAIRLALWRAAVELAVEHPLTGLGANQFREGLKRLQAIGRYPADAQLYAHPHNTVLSVIAQYGVTGLIVFAAAVGLAWRGLGRSPPAARTLGRTLIVAWLLLGLTNDVLAHQNTLRCIVFGLAVCLAAREWDPTVRRAAKT